MNINWIRTYEHRISTPMQCVRHLLGGESVEAYLLVYASSGYGLATCDEHSEATGKVVRELLEDDDKLKALFARHGAPVEEAGPEQAERQPEPDDERGPGEGALYGKLPGSGRPGPSVADVMFGKLDR
ncbi:hypothetical protein HEP81_04623 [Streptomyces griseofuscus]|uniref:Uncharacterized protein n=1 Tax=Streptomyces griseofuscus TaxID=146922 RepID=A0A7H1Q3L6_9ACTN|nr:hypothetical protein [Streptomyces griseofuscus]QNT94896.1 hypothetical protein HEP81_04623 [Streptomyces griseofuscus]